MRVISKDLAPGLERAAGSSLNQFRSLARSFSQQHEPIKLALTTPWSTGQCEGQMCRVKLIERLGCGRLIPIFSANESCIDR